MSATHPPYVKYDTYKHDMINVKQHLGRWWVWAINHDAPLSYHRSERAAKRRMRKILKRWGRLW